MKTERRVFETFAEVEKCRGEMNKQPFCLDCEKKDNCETFQAYINACVSKTKTEKIEEALTINVEKEIRLVEEYAKVQACIIENPELKCNNLLSYLYGEINELEEIVAEICKRINEVGK